MNDSTAARTRRFWAQRLQEQRQHVPLAGVQEHAAEDMVGELLIEPPRQELANDLAAREEMPKVLPGKNTRHSLWGPTQP
eukprot:11017575-Lingulodinium_polyedra.AAC.1